MRGYAIEFDFIDDVGQDEAEGLFESFNDLEDVEASVEGYHHARGFLTATTLIALIAVSTVSVASLSITIVFIFTVLRRGVVADLTGDRPIIRKSRDLP